MSTKTNKEAIALIQAMFRCIKNHKPFYWKEDDEKTLKHILVRLSDI